MHPDTVNITFGFFKICYFSSCLFSIVFKWNFPFYFSGELQKNLGKFLTIQFNNSSNNCSMLSWTSPAFLSLCHPLTHFVLEVYPSQTHFWLWISFLFHSFHCCFPMVHHCLLHLLVPFLSYYIGFVCLPETCQTYIIIFWDEGIGLTSTWLWLSVCFLKNVS